MDSKTIALIASLILAAGLAVGELLSGGEAEAATHHYINQGSSK